MSREDIYLRQNLGNSSSIGARCALVLVDLVNGFVDENAFGGPHIESAARATVIDAMQHNFRTVAIEPHQANLFGMHQQYADVMRATPFSN